MPRAPLIRTNQFAYHVTSRSNNRDWFYIPLVDSWDVFTKHLSRTAEIYRLEIHLFVLMSNHFHLLLSTPNCDIDRAMQHFLSCSTKEIQRRTARINHVFGGRYKWSVLGNAAALAYAYKYIARNPVRAGICQRVQDFPYITLNDPRSCVPTTEGLGPYWSLIPRQPAARWAWLNESSDYGPEKLIGRALRRSQFQLSTHSNHQSDLRVLREQYGVEQLARAPFGTKSSLTRLTF